VTRPGAARRPGLAARLLTAQLLVLVTGVITAALVASAVGPSIFHRHLGEVAHTDTPQMVTTHAERAFRQASVISWTLGVLAALLVAFVASAYVSRRIARPVETLAIAASQVAAGRYDVAVPAPALGSEFDSLTESFTAMAARLHQTEVTRRRLLSDLGHEMRTPIATLDAYLEAIEDGIATLDTETVAMLRAQTSRLSLLAEDISAVSRAEEHRLDLNPVLVSPAKLVTTAVAAVADRFAAAGVSLTEHTDPDLPLVHVDPDRMAQVLGNLLDNALRHTPSGGTVSVSAIPANSGDSVQLTVTDTGAGIPAEHLPHLFERFYRVDAARDRAHGGSGIGLTIAKALTEAHGGRISVTSAGAGTGTTFTILLPVAS
jgi:signal transduction histidine kinase